LSQRSFIELGLKPAVLPLAERLARGLGDRPLAEAVLRLVCERAPDEQLVLAFLTKLVEQSPSATAELLRDSLWAANLVFCLGASELIGTGLATMGPEWASFFRCASSLTAASTCAAIRFDPSSGSPEISTQSGSSGNRGGAKPGEPVLACRSLDASNGGNGLVRDPKAARQELARFKNSIFLTIAIGDLLGRLAVEDTVRAMSLLADECIHAAWKIAAAESGGGEAIAADFCIIAMGKLGAGELNLSSDIDLMYIYGGPEDAQHQDAARRLGETVSDILSSHCFRVDMRLRPGGRYSPLVIALNAAMSFYETLGQTWERAALLRARSVAGAVNLGDRLIAELSRFIYRSYLDFDTLRQLRAMKRQIEEAARSPDLLERDVKLGYGGIRELEFIVQALTLIYGGRDPRLRIRQTLAAIGRLETYNYLGQVRAEELKTAYLFLRDVEHKLQIASGLQTHRLPADAEQFAVLAARLGFGKQPDSADALRQALKRHRGLVATMFREMLAGGEEESAHPASPAAITAWREAFEPERSAAGLQRLGFVRPEQSADQLALLVRGPEHVPMRPRRHELLEALGPRLLDELGALADPDQALLNLASFISAVGARTSFLALLEQHPATRRVLLGLFASSNYLSSLFIRHPDMLDTLVRSDLARPRRPAGELEGELSEVVAASPDFESRLDALRAFCHQEFLRVAIADLAGDLGLDGVQEELTELAEALLRQALELARTEVGVRFMIPPDLKLCVIGMGRLGGCEMSYNSDLDLIFVYEWKSEVAAGGHEIAARIMQKLISVLEARTREGYVYKLDLRLRPSGNAGPLVTSLEGFRAYHQRSSAVWERQALVRARVIAGDHMLAHEVEQARQVFVFGRSLPPAEVAEIAAMRARMEKEIGTENRERLNLKQGSGGLVDVEFITQMMALRHGHRLPQLRRRNTTELIRGLAETGLLTTSEAATLESDYRFMLQLENRLRIETDQPAWALPIDHERLTPVARRMGLEGENCAARLLYEVEERRSRIRALFELLFARGQES
jgi:[glutamine synthetase] adenylyltransferase / [glutamine synthetase]-adenylyl-L-tyrosine phosphorylase